MIVKCINNRIENVCTEKTSEALFRIYSRLDGEVEEIQKGRLYTVYAMLVVNEVKWYFLRFREETWYPIWCHGCFFETVDDTPSKYWMQTPFRYWEESEQYAHVIGSSDEGMLYAFYEFTENTNFYDNLFERYDEEVGIFKQIAQKMKDEAVF